MIRPPLFGKDSSPHYTAPRLAGAGTGGFCIIFFLFVWFAPAPDSKPKYETVRIVLETTPVEEIDTENNSQTNTVANEQIQENTNSTPVKKEPKYIRS